jgi:hypothetical protein
MEQVDKKIDALHEDLQYDFRKEWEAIDRA